MARVSVTVEIASCTEVLEAVAHGWQWRCERVGYREENGQLTQVCVSYAGRIFTCRIVGVRTGQRDTLPMCYIDLECDVPPPDETTKVYPPKTYACVAAAYGDGAGFKYYGVIWKEITL